MTVFTWWGEPFGYADFAYNTTRLNERAVELPIARQFLTGQVGRLLEVGNVLSHYYPELPQRAVVDRYEEAKGVSNIDVFRIDRTWDRIVSISTLEHVRWDEATPREVGRSAAAVEHLRDLLAPGGRMLVTIPMGWNTPLDDWLLDGAGGAVRACTLVRHGDGWVQTKEPAVRPYGFSTAWAESVWIGEWEA
jgi:SAM-dependent methyltransferase